MGARRASSQAGRTGARTIPELPPTLASPSSGGGLRSSRPHAHGGLAASSSYPGWASSVSARISPTPSSRRCPPPPRLVERRFLHDGARGLRVDSARSVRLQVWRFPVAIWTMEAEMACCAAGHSPAYLPFRDFYRCAVRPASREAGGEMSPGRQAHRPPRPSHRAWMPRSDFLYELVFWKAFYFWFHFFPSKIFWLPNFAENYVLNS
jgi:hypothetical protein